MQFLLSLSCGFSHTPGEAAGIWGHRGAGHPRGPLAWLVADSSCWLGAPSTGLLTGAPVCGLSSVVAQGSQISWMVIGLLSAAFPREPDEAHGLF